MQGLSLIRAGAVCALAIVLFAAVALVGVADRATAHRAHLECNVDNRALKTLSDPQRDLVRLRPTATSLAAINRLRRPHPIPRARTTGFQRRVWRVRAQIVEFKLYGDGDVTLVLYDGKRAYMPAVMPSPACLSAKTRARRAIAGARGFLEGLCGPARSHWRDLGAVAIVDGVGFWSSARGRDGHARKGAELHPVTRVRLVAGCA